MAFVANKVVAPSLAQTGGFKAPPGSTKIDIQFRDPVHGCDCDICRSKRLDLEKITVFEVWTDEGRFISDKATQACEYASALDRPVRVRTKVIPGIL